MFDHYAMVGVATVIDNYPLYYDAANEHGLCIAGLNFPGNACYHK
jgi:choloylglycine hydrolase